MCFSALGAKRKIYYVGVFRSFGIFNCIVFHFCPRKFVFEKRFVLACVFVCRCSCEFVFETVLHSVCVFMFVGFFYCWCLCLFCLSVCGSTCIRVCSWRRQSCRAGVAMLCVGMYIRRRCCWCSASGDVEPATGRSSFTFCIYLWPLFCFCFVLFLLGFVLIETIILHKHGRIMLYNFTHTHTHACTYTHG